MYTSSNITGTYSDSKYTVADILSSMANGQPTTTSYSPEASYMSGIVTGTTPTLTPTTLASIEQTFIELTSVPATTAADQTADLSRQSGFVPPVVHPASSAGSGGMSIKSEYSDFCECDDNSSDSNWGVPEPKRSRSSAGTAQTTSVISYAQTSTTTATNANGTPRKTPGRRGRNDVLSPEEDAKRRLRRERNKLAAAKCRQRRVDHTNTLIGETEELEEVRASLENEIQQLQQQKEQLEFLLEAHKPMCAASKAGLLAVKAEPSEDPCACSSAIAVKVEPPASTHPSASTTGASGYGARPTSLPLPVQTLSSSTQATGVMLSTPSNVFSQIGLESMVDGHTGLTPITGPPSCASEVKRASSDSSPNENLGSPTLMAL